jgi:hypothetical protein
MFYVPFSDAWASLQPISEANVLALVAAGRGRP